MDEQPVQLLKETRVPIPATKEHPRRVDYEYERAGTASIFMFCEPLAGWRQVTRAASGGRRSTGPMEVADLLGRRYAGGREGDPGVRQPEHAHQGGVLRGVRAGAGAALVRRLEFRHTPKHGSWLNIAENELSAMTRQCVHGRRFATIDDVARGNGRLARRTSTTSNAASTGSSRSTTPA